MARRSLNDIDLDMKAKFAEHTSAEGEEKVELLKQYVALQLEWIKMSKSLDFDEEDEMELILQKEQNRKISSMQDSVLYNKRLIERYKDSDKE